MYNPREQERVNSGRTIEEGLGGDLGNQAFLGDLWTKLKNKAKENERLRQEWREENPGGYPGIPYDQKLRQDQENEYPKLRQEPQEFSQTDVNRKVADLVSDTAFEIAKKHPEWVGLENDYIADGTRNSNRPQFAQQIFERPDAIKNLSDEDFTDLLQRELTKGKDLQPLGSGGGGQYPKWQTFYNPNTGNIHTNTEGYGTTITRPDGYQRKGDW